MPLNVLIIPDKFKGTLTAREAAQAIAAGWRAMRPDDALDLLPMSDGGDGFGEIVSNLLGAVAQTVKTVDAAHRACLAQWWWEAKSQTAIIEAARVNGLAQLPKGKYHPFELDTFGLGAVFEAAAKCGARRCLAGIGGSATNDGGFGLAVALGWKFSNTHNAKIERWTELRALATVHPPARPKLFDELVVAVDVQNPLLGEQGCSRVYGPQKGLKPEDFAFADGALEQLATTVAKEFHHDYANEPGAGAAGGLGFGLRCFAGAQLEPGFGLFARHAKLKEHLQSAQLVLTGEGAIDESTVMGKGVGQLAGLCQELKVPCVGIAGLVRDTVQIQRLFAQTHALTPTFTSREKAMAEPASCLEQLAARAASSWTAGHNALAGRDRESASDRPSSNSS